MPRASIIAFDRSINDAELERIARNIARELLTGAEEYRAAGQPETAARLEAAALRFQPTLKN